MEDSKGNIRRDMRNISAVAIEIRKGDWGLIRNKSAVMNNIFEVNEVIGCRIAI